MNLCALYEQMINDESIIKEYDVIAENERQAGNYATHDLSHIKRVVDYCARAAQLLGLCDEEVAGIKIAALLHDIGCASGSKNGHAERSYEWAKNYLYDKITGEMCERILAAISEHSGNASGVYGKILAFADKIDVCKERILPHGLMVAGNRQYAHIKGVNFWLGGGTFVVGFNTDGRMDIDEMIVYYFTKKIFRSIESVADCFGFEYEILIDEVKIIGN